MGDEKISDLCLHYENQLNILSRVTQKINENLEIKVILRTLVEAALELTSSKDGTAGLYIDGQMVFKEYFADGQWVPIDFSFPPGYGVPGWVLANKKPYISNDTINDPVVIQEIREQLGFYNLADTPILDRNGNLLGCFEIHNTENARPFDEKDISLLKGLSSSAAIAMENARIIENLQETQLQLSKSKTYLQSLFEETPVSLWEEDFSAVKKLLEEITREQGVSDIGSYLREHPEVVLQCSKLAQVTGVNKATIELFEADSKDDLLTNLDKIFTEDSLENFCEELICLATKSSSPRAQGINKTLSGKEINVLVRWSILPGYEDNWGKVVVSMIDVTRERELDKLKDEFISTAAHELRTPLTVLLGYTELLQMADAGRLKPEKRQECFENIFAKVMFLDRIIDDLLDVGKIESGRSLTIEKVPFQFSELLLKVCRSHQHETKNHTLNIELPDRNVCLLADSDRMTQVLDNLLSNAIKFSPDGGVIKVISRVESDRLTVSISDSGFGMTEQQQKRVFDKFFRADTSNTAIRGLGLGLSISKNIIEAHGGTIWLESVKQVGTTVSFTIPLVEP